LKYVLALVGPRPYRRAIAWTMPVDTAARIDPSGSDDRSDPVAIRADPSYFPRK
jgi:hypothetical protein